MERRDFTRPTQVITPITKDALPPRFESIEMYAASYDVVVLWAFGCDAAVLFGREEDVMAVIQHAWESDPSFFHSRIHEA